jgi:hypothetical protein
MILHHNSDAFSGPDSLIPQEHPNLVDLLSDSAIGEGFPAVTGDVLKGNVIGHAIPVLAQLLEKV